MKTFGKFQVINESPIYDNKRHCMLLKCRCECGVELYVNKYTLEDGSSTCCRKCFGKKHLGENNPNFRGYKSIPGSMITRIKRRAKKQNITWGLTQEFLHQKYIEQKKKCAITSLPISFDDNTASLDRIDSSVGYIPTNVHWVHKDVNIMKNGYDIDYFAFMCHKVAKNITKISKENKFVYGKH